MKFKCCKLGLLSRICSCLSSDQWFQTLFCFQKCVNIVFDWMMFLISPTLLFAAHAAICVVIFVYYMYILPDLMTNWTQVNKTQFYYFRNNRIIQACCHIITAIFLSINILFNFAACAFTPPVCNYF